VKPFQIWPHNSKSSCLVPNFGTKKGGETTRPNNGIEPNYKSLSQLTQKMDCFRIGRFLHPWVRSWDLSIHLAFHLLKQYLRSISRCVD